MVVWQNKQQMVWNNESDNKDNEDNMYYHEMENEENFRDWR